MLDTAPSDFGTHLRHARESRGVSLRHIANTTKISMRALEALERNNPSQLPGGIFTRAFVRAYAREIGLDAEDTVARFIHAFPHDSGAPESSGPNAGSSEPEPDSVRLSSTIKLLVAISIIVGGLLLYLTLRGHSAARPAAAIPANGSRHAVHLGSPVRSSIASLDDVSSR